MKKLLMLLAFFVPSLLWCGTQDDRNLNVVENVNSRYTIESVDLAAPDRQKLSRQLREDLDKLIGQKFEQSVVDNLATRIRRDIHAAGVTAKISRGDKPEQIKITFEARHRKLEEDADLTKFSYSSKQGWTGGVETGFHFAGNQLVVGVQSDGDQLLERYAGLNARISIPIGARVRARFAVESFHEQWNQATVDTLARESDTPGIYRSRQNFEPSVAVAITPALTFTTGLSFQQLQTQFPAAHTEGANAVVNTLRYHKRWDGTSNSNTGQELEAGYSLRAATKALGTDFAYTRNSFDALYSHGWENQEVLLRFKAGTIAGEAPLFERYALGNSETLRGWNKFDLDPLGGSRMVHGTIAYRYRIAQVFYDTGSVWDHGQALVVRRSAGFSFILGEMRDGLAFTVAFPIRSGNVTPMFIVSSTF